MSEILTDPSNLARGLERMIESERGLSSGEDEASWLGRISEIDAKQERLLDLRLDGNITPEQFRARSARLGEARAAAEAQLQAASSRLSRLMVMCLCFRAHCSSFCPCSVSCCCCATCLLCSSPAARRRSSVYGWVVS